MLKYPSRALPVVAAFLLVMSPARSALADSVALAAGDVLTGTIVEETADHVVIDHPNLGQITIPRAQIAAIVRTPPADAVGEEVPETEAGEEVAEAEGAVEEAAEEPAKPEKEWKSHFDLNFGGDFGNTDKQTLFVGATSVRDVEDMRTAFDIGYFWGASNGDTDQNKLSAGVVNDWKLPDVPKWFIFAQGRFDYDQFQSWEYRLTGHAGPGYNLIQKDNFTLDLRGGVGVIKEFNSPNDDPRLEFMFGGNLTWQLTDTQTLEASAFIFPDIDGEYRQTSSLLWRWTPDETSNWNINARLEQEYQSQTAPGRKHNDLRIVAGVGFDF